MYPTAARLVALAALITAPAALAQPDAPVAFTNVNVVPMDAERVLANATVLVRGDRIVAVGAAADIDVPATARVVDGRGRYLMPGLAEMHAHVPGPGDAQQLEDVLFLYVANGITTARGMLGQPAHLELRVRIARHDIIGPRLVTSGPSLSGQSVASPADARRLVTAQAMAGYDFVKLHPGLGGDAFDAAVDAAAAAGIELAGHVSAEVGLGRALEAGQATVDHLDGYIEYLIPDSGEALPPGGLFGLGRAQRVDTDLIPAAADATRRAGVWNVPTQSLIEHWFAPEPSAGTLAARPEMAYVAAGQVEQWVRSKQDLTSQPSYSAADARRLVDIRRQLILALHEAGAGLLLGSDAPQVFNVPGFSIHHELAMLVAAGLSPYESLATGTVNPAAFFGVGHERGRVAAGQGADLVLVDGNPLEDVAAAARPAGVMLRGRWLDRETLDRGLAEIAARHAR